MLSLGKFRLKSQRAITTHPLKWLRFKILSHRKLYILLVGVSHGTPAPEKAEQFLIMFFFSLLAHNSTPKYLLKRNESMSPHRLANKHLQKLHAKWPKPETTQPKDGWTNVSKMERCACPVTQRASRRLQVCFSPTRGLLGKLWGVFLQPSHQCLTQGNECLGNICSCGFYQME